jgi:hypothetical protein
MRPFCKALAMLLLTAAMWCGAPLQRVAACFTVKIPPYEIDPALRDSDTTPPTAFRDVSALGVRVASLHCRGHECTEGSCPDWGGLRISFSRPKDDQTPNDALGYRLVWMGASMPDGMLDATDHVWRLGSATEVVVELDYDAIAGLDGEIALIAVDRAGNESAPSEPVHVAVLGCTTYFDQPTCDAAPGCSVLSAVGALPRGDAGRMLPLAAAAGCVWWMRRKRQQR